MKKENDNSTENKGFLYEKQIWMTFYRNFNDDNIRHSEFAFDNNNLSEASAFELHLENIRWVYEIGPEYVKKEKDTLPQLQVYISECEEILAHIKKEQEE